MKCRRFSLYWLFFSCLLVCSCTQKKSSQEAPASGEPGLEQVHPSVKVEAHVKGSDDELPDNQAPSADLAPAPGIPLEHPAPFPGVVPPPPLPLPPPIPVVVDERVIILCGDGVREGAEQCDDGNDDNADGCDNFCRRPDCGNGIVEGIEQCDSPTNTNCTATCQLKLCGNGVIDAGEMCDPPNVALQCNPNCQPSVCGNGVVEFGEACDAGAENGTSACSATCTLVVIPGKK